MKLAYEMRRDDVVVCEARSEHCFLDEEGNIIRLRKEYPEFYETLTRLQGIRE